MVKVAFIHSVLGGEVLLSSAVASVFRQRQNKVSQANADRILTLCSSFTSRGQKVGEYFNALSQSRRHDKGFAIIVICLVIKKNIGLSNLTIIS